MTDAATVVSGVNVGEYDAFLDLISQAVADRKKVVASKVMHTLVVGDTIRFLPNVKPKYLAGATATVEKVARTRIHVRMHEPTGKYAGIITVPVGIYEKV